MNLKKYLPIIGVTYTVLMFVTMFFDFYLNSKGIESIIYWKGLYAFSTSEREGNYIARAALTSLVISAILPYYFVKEKSKVSTGLKILTLLIMIGSPIFFIVCIINIFNILSSQLLIQ